MRPESPTVSVIIPTLNEEENIEGIISKILAGGAPLEMEIIVVDDGSRDETQAIVRRLEQTLPVFLLARDKPKDGLAGAVLAGARAAKAGVVLVIDADGSHPPEKIPDLAQPVIRGERDMVIGSRYMKGGSTPGWSRKRRLMSRAASACAWPFTDVHDALSGFFAVRRELLAEIPSDAAGFKIALEILVRGGDTLRAGETPIAFRDRELGQSKMGTGVILTYFRRLLALSGWRESQDSVGLAIAKTALVWVVDFAAFAFAWWSRGGLSAANLMGFTAGAALNAWLKAAQLPRERSQSPAFLTRLLFVSLLALFLRSGVLATCARWFGWPWLAAIVPAIIAGWVVLFLGYALFIWPERSQYGSGVRWRVAAMGATVYLLAFRMAYLYAVPVDSRLAYLPGSPDGMDRMKPDGFAPYGPWYHLTGSLRDFGTMLLGATSAGLNLPAILCWLAGAWAVFQAAQRLFDKTTAFRALLLFSVLPVFFWRGAQFGPATVLICCWAVVVWVMTFGLRWQWQAGAVFAAAATVLYWCPGIWLPAMALSRDPANLAKAGLFLLAPLVMVTPAGLIALALYYSHCQAEDRRGPALAAAGCAAVVAVIVLLGVMSGAMGYTAGGAIWITLLPFIAWEMRRPARWWPPILYGCVICYGVYFYLLAFPSS